MFRASLLSLSNGQSYSDVEILEIHDLNNYGVDCRLFEENTLAFYVGGNLHISQILNLRICQVERMAFPGHEFYHANRLVIDKDITYSNCDVIVDPNQLDLPDIMPNFKKFIFNHAGGTVLTLSRNVIGIISADNRRGGTDKVVPTRSYVKQRPMKYPKTAKLKPTEPEV